MAYSAITTGEIAVGEPTKNSLFTKIKDNFIDHESRISTLEGSGFGFRPLEFHLTKAAYDDYVAASATYYGFLRVNFDITLSAIRMLYLKAGGSGTQTHDVLYKRGASAFATVLTSPISVAFGSTLYSSTSGTLAVTSLLAGDILALNVSAAQTGDWQFLTELEFTV